MINDELKIKIIQYLEGELDKASESEVEEILNSDEEANQFCNQIKSLNIKLNEYTQTNEYQSYSKKVDAAVDSTIKKHLGSKKKSNIFSFVSFFTLQNVTGYALTAALFLTFGIMVDKPKNAVQPKDPISFPMSLLEEPVNLIIDPDLISSDLQQTTFEKNVFKKRNMTEDENIKDILKTTLDEMIDAKSANGKLTYGSETYLIFLDSKPIDDSELSCYYGNVFNDGYSQKILFCKSEEDLSLTFIN